MPRRRAVDAGIRKAWSAAEAAGALGVPYETVLRLIHDQQLAAFKVGRYWVIPVKELDRYVEERTAETRRAAS